MSNTSTPDGYMTLKISLSPAKIVRTIVVPQPYGYSSLTSMRHLKNMSGRSMPSAGFQVPSDGS